MKKKPTNKELWNMSPAQIKYRRKKLLAEGKLQYPNGKRSEYLKEITEKIDKSLDAFHLKI
jgi:hypothetical protein